MRERRRDSALRRSPPYRPRDRDRRDSFGSDRRDVSGRFARSLVRPEWDSCGLDVDRGPAMARDWEGDVGGGWREYGDLVPYEVERRRRDGSSKREREEERDDEHKWKLCRRNEDALAGEVYLSRLGLASKRLVESVTSEEMLSHGVGGSSLLMEEPYLSHEAERSRLINSREFSNIIPPTVTQCGRGEPEPSGSFGSRVYNYSVSPERKVFRYDEGDQSAWYNSRSLNHSDSARPVMEPCRASELEQSTAAFPAMKGEHGGLRYYEGGREREPYFLTSPVSRVGSSSAEFQQDRYGLVSLNSRCDFGGNISNRIDGRNLEFIGRNYTSQVVYTRDTDGYPDRHSSRRYQKQKDGEVESFHDSGYSRVLTDVNSGCHVSTSGTKRSREMVCESRKSYDRGCYSASDPAAEYIYGDGLTQNMGRKMDLSMLMRGPLPTSSVTDSIVDKVDGADTLIGIRSRERTLDQYDSLKADSPFVQLRSNMLEYRDEEGHHFRKAHPEEREDIYLDNRSRQSGEDYRFGFHARMYPDVNGADVMVERGGRDLHPRIGHLCEEKEVDLDDESQQLRKDYQYGSYARVYADAGGPSALMVKHDEEALRFRRGHLDGTKLYLDDESLQLGKDYQLDLHNRTGLADGRRRVYLTDETLHSRDTYGFVSPTLGEPSKVVYERMAQVNDDHFRKMGMTFMNSESGRFSDHGVANDYRDKQYRDDYVMAQTSSEQLRYSIAERSSDFENCNHGSSSYPRIPVKERLGGRVNDRNINVNKRTGAGKKVLPWVKHIVSNRKCLGRNQENTSKVRNNQQRTSSNSKKSGKKQKHPRIPRGSNN